MRRSLATILILLALAGAAHAQTDDLGNPIQSYGTAPAISTQYLLVIPKLSVVIAYYNTLPPTTLSNYAGTPSPAGWVPVMADPMAQSDCQSATSQQRSISLTNDSGTTKTYDVTSAQTCVSLSTWQGGAGNVTVESPDIN